jgi:TRAP-type C4-dicarboxylate transport system permease small subunit
MKWKHRAKRLVDRVLTYAVGSLFFGMTLLIMIQVILRYVFNSSIPASSEALRYAFIYTTFLGAAVLIGSNEHIAIHLVTRKLRRPVQRGIAAFGSLVIVALHVYLLVLSLRWISVAGVNLSEELKIPLVYIQIALPIGCGLAALYALDSAIDALFDPEWSPTKERSE